VVNYGTASEASPISRKQLCGGVIDLAIVHSGEAAPAVVANEPRVEPANLEETLLKSQ